MTGAEGVAESTHNLSKIYMQSYVPLIFPFLQRILCDYNQKLKCTSLWSISTRDKEQMKYLSNAEDGST